MFKIGEYVVYKRDVCKIIDTKIINNNDYYVLVPVNDESLKINVSMDNINNYLRKIITKEEVEEIIKKIPSIEVLEANKNIEADYRALLSTGKHEDLITIIKTTYQRNKERIDNNKKIGDKDRMYFDKSEKYLYTEFAYALGITYEDAKKYVIESVMKDVR